MTQSIYLRCMLLFSIAHLSIRSNDGAPLFYEQNPNVNNLFTVFPQIPSIDGPIQDAGE